MSGVSRRNFQGMMLTVETATNASSAPAALEIKNLVKRRKDAAKTARIVKLSVTPNTASPDACPPPVIMLAIQ